MVVAAEDLPEAGSETPSSTAYLGAMLIASIYEVFSLVCPQWGGELKIVSILTEAERPSGSLNQFRKPATPTRVASSRAPPDRLEADSDQTHLNESEEVEPAPEFEIDQTVSW